MGLFGKSDKSSNVMPEPVAKYLEAQGLDSTWVRNLKAVSKNHNGAKAMDVRIYDDVDANAKNVKVKEYASLDANPDLVLYEGWFDTDSNKVELVEKTKCEVSKDETILSHCQIWKAIAQLTKPGSSVYFFLGASPASGGPLTRGAALIELNPEYPGKKQRKYNVYTVDVDGIQLKGKGQKLWDSDEGKKIADWIKERHYKPSR